ncbi:phage/plasmid primase, P4 family [Jeotgalibacillus proteolyticus]|uniref:SF3 helicase domain-containing protein n=1 Tax=Jeotgalibacillus proteolyticus TaxID=2082395 RepID=A0A2S5GB04_9BACL|nr:phage/plasmid primase, P4 family [Jeotgalibacillus proteolyticus]PPA70179.1 hypothetical protein C4B60_11370 [Jeotgalibacillus proteolyticus]
MAIIDSKNDYLKTVERILPGGKVFKLKGYSNGNTDYQKAKRSIVKGFTTDAAVHLNDSQIKQHLDQGGWCGILIPKGSIVIDVDDHGSAEKLQQLLEGEGVNHHAIMTPNGRQFIFQCRSEVNKAIKQDSKLFTTIGVTVDTRVMNKGYIVMPSPNTENRTIIAQSMDGADELPEYLLPIRRKASLKDANYSLPIPLQDGSRNQEFSKWAGYLRAWEVPKKLLIYSMKLIHRYFVEDHGTFTEEEARATIRSAVNWQPEQPASKRLSAADDFDVIPTNIGYFEGKKFIPQYLAEEIMAEKPMVFEGKTLFAYEDGVYREVSDYVIRSLCMEKLGKDFRKTYADETIHFIQVATFRPIGERSPSIEFINVKNGLLDWREEKLHPHTPDYFSTSQLPITYNPEASCPGIEKFFKSVVPHDAIPLVEEWFGYCMLPTAKYGKALMLIGSGSNGKSKFIDLFEAFIGAENLTNVPLQDLEHNRFKLAKLYGKLANTSADLSAEALKTSSTFKNVVTGDRVSAEFKGKDSFDFRPFARLIFSANELPRSSDLTPGFFRRWVIIPFPNKFGPGGKPADPDLLEKLTVEEELSGLLNVALQGLLRLEFTSEFTNNKTTEDALEKYRKEIDNVVTFIEEKCLLDPEKVTPKQEVFAEYQSWCMSSGYKSLGKVKFYHRFEAQAAVMEVRLDKQSERSYKGVEIVSFL